MHCKDCGFANGEDDHRCLRCGRRLFGVVIAAPAGYSGANALAMAPVFDQNANDTHEFAPPVQSRLFTTTPDHNVIPFDQLRQRVTGRATPPQPAPAKNPAVAPPVAPPVAPRAQVKQPARPAAEQGSLDFVKATAAPRTLKDDVPAQIFCEQTVATPQHRLVASAIDAAMILLGFGVFALVLQLSGSGFGSGKFFWMALAASLGLISLFYGLVWAIAGRETAGMDMADLQLITFDGFPVDPRSRAIRVASTWLSFCSGGLGLVWAIADEENLTWHDHISKTFPTFREVPRNFVKQRR
jgi:hypothetical protein